MCCVVGAIVWSYGVLRGRGYCLEVLRGRGYCLELWCVAW